MFLLIPKVKKQLFVELGDPSHLSVDHANIH